MTSNRKEYLKVQKRIEHSARLTDSAYISRAIFNQSCRGLKVIKDKSNLAVRLVTLDEELRTTSDGRKVERGKDPEIQNKTRGL